MTEIKSTYTGLIIFVVLNIVVGLNMVLNPDTLPSWFIILIGILWILDGILYILKIVAKYLLEKIEKGEIKVYCGECGKVMDEIRPGKYQCNNPKCNKKVYSK